MEVSGERDARAVCRPRRPMHEYARRPLRYRPSGSEKIGFSNSWCSEGVVSEESSSRPEGKLL